MNPQQGLDPMSRLADLLWYERQLLEFLLFKLVSANLMLNADERRFVPPAMAEVEKVIDEIRRIETERDGAVRAVGSGLGVQPNLVSLAYLVQHAPSRLRGVFEDHRVGFMELTTEIEDITKENRRLVTIGLSGTRGAFSLLEPGEGNATYDATGRPTSKPAIVARRVTEVL
jgi:hypothetical protein